MKTKNIKKVLIANRGEIAVRIIRACKELGIKTVAVYSQADKDSLHIKLADESICVGEAHADESYLNIPNIISACEIMNADAIHPGYGFLSENSDFTSICEECNITYIGPSSEMIASMGDKIKAKEMMKNAGVPVIPGFDGGVVNNDDELKKQYCICKLEAKKCFESEEIYIEKFISAAKHIEFQIIADNYGNAIYLPERDCSMQRNHQKVLEESPSKVVTEELREEIGSTVVNTRIQVEHPISEEVSNIDILKEQIKVADGEKLEFTQEDVRIDGCSIECRINAEDAFDNFRPCPGTIENIIMPGGIGVRIDTNVYNGYTIPIYYDSMILKLIVHGKNRGETIDRIQRALDEMKIEGVKTNIDFHKWIINKEAFRSGEYCTDFLENELVGKNESIK